MYLLNRLFQIYLRLKDKSFRSVPLSVNIPKDLELGKDVYIQDSVIGNNVTLKDNTKVGSGAVIRNVNLGNNSHIEKGVIVTGNGEGHIKIGRECYIGLYNVLDFSDNISIGDFVHIAGPSTGIWTHSSAKMCLNGVALDEKTPENRPTSPVSIEDQVYIGGNCTIYPGVTIKHHSIVAPNSAVTDDIGPYEMVGGVPAEVVKKIKENGHANDLTNDYS